jgi:hypothetical protein
MTDTRDQFHERESQVAPPVDAVDFFDQWLSAIGERDQSQRLLPD